MNRVSRVIAVSNDRNIGVTIDSIGGRARMPRPAIHRLATRRTGLCKTGLGKIGLGKIGLGRIASLSIAIRNHGSRGEARPTDRTTRTRRSIRGTRSTWAEIPTTDAS